MPRDSSSTVPRDTYRRHTHRPLNCLMFVLPMLLFFHIGAAFCKPRSLLAVQDLGNLLNLLGANTAYLPAALLVIIALLVEQVATRQPWRIQPKVLGGMAVESLAWMLPLAALGLISGRMLQADGSDPSAGGGFIAGILTAVGAGIYEEFIFRLLFVGLAVVLCVKVFGLRRDVVSLSAVLVAAICFSLYHFRAEQFTIAHFPWHDFIFRMTAGIYLGALYLFRGFGVAVGAHAVYDIYLVILR